MKQISTCKYFWHNFRQMPSWIKKRNETHTFAHEVACCHAQSKSVPVQLILKGLQFLGCLKTSEPGLLQHDTSEYQTVAGNTITVALKTCKKVLLPPSVPRRANVASETKSFDV